MPGCSVFFLSETYGRRRQVVQLSMCRDSRITPLEAKLRRYNLDELHGLWNVLIGNVSFVEPLRVFMDTTGIKACLECKPMHKQPVCENAPAHVKGVSETVYTVSVHVGRMSM